MKSIISLFVLALTASAVLGCMEYNWLAMNYGFEVTSSQSGSALRYCSTLKTDGTCCAVSVVNGFQDKADAYIAYLEGNAADRDAFILERRNDIEEKRGAMERIAAASARMTNYESTNTTLLARMAYAQSEYGNMATAIADWDNIVSRFPEYQSARATCINSLLEVQSNLWCVACQDDPSAIAGIDPDLATITLTPAQKRVMRVDCYPYIEAAAYQSYILTAYYIRNYLDTLAGTMERLADGNSDEFDALDEEILDIRIPENEITGPGRHPGECSGTSYCEWMFYSIWDNGVINNATIIRGAPPLRDAVFTLPSTRRLEGEERMLANGNWQPTANDITLDFDFAQNPGNLDNSAPIKNGVIACVIALVASLFF